jgi:hypothetical protein
MCCDRSRLIAEPRIKELRALRDAVFDELDAIRAGTSKPPQADAMTDWIDWPADE